MPAEGIDFLSKQDLLSYEEMLRICHLLVEQGVRKIRITGGEPFIRKDLIYFLRDLTQISDLEELHLTTNGTLSTKIVHQLKSLGISSVNLSLDTLDRARFLEITRRDLLPQVLETLNALIKHGIKTKINAVVMAAHNIEDIIPLVRLTQTKPVDIRFIEEMPFNGSVREGLQYWDHTRILEQVREVFPDIHKVADPAYSTSANYQIPGFLGKVGIIAAYSRTFCGTCNRIRLTPKGILKTCLYDKGTFSLRDLMRAGATDLQLLTAVREAIGLKAVDGFAAEQARSSAIIESMASIGG